MDRAKQGDGKFESISIKVYVSAEPEFKVIVPKSGRNAGKEVELLSVRASRPRLERGPDGNLSRTGADYYTLTLFGRSAMAVKDRLARGMCLMVEGSLVEQEWTGRDGVRRVERGITVREIGLSLKQPGIRSIVFEPPSRTLETALEAAPGPRQGVVDMER